MGYYTDFTLAIASDKHIDDLDTKLNDISGYTFHDGYMNGKWYDHEKDMRAFSKLYPDVLFTLHGEGEENGDIWDEYYKDGKMQAAHAVVTIEPFDESKLK